MVKTHLLKRYMYIIVWLYMLFYVKYTNKICSNQVILTWVLSYPVGQDVLYHTYQL